MFRTSRRLTGGMTALALAAVLVPEPAVARSGPCIGEMLEDRTRLEVNPSGAAEALEAIPQLYLAVYSGTYRDGTKTGTPMFNVENDTSSGAMTGRLFIDGFAVRYSGHVTADYTVSLDWAMNSYRGTLTGQLVPDLSAVGGTARFWAAGRRYQATFSLDRTQ